MSHEPIVQPGRNGQHATDAASTPALALPCSSLYRAPAGSSAGVLSTRCVRAAALRPRS